MSNYIIQTARLGLRNWQTKDIAPAKLMNADARVMEFFPDTWTTKQTEDFIQRMRKHYKKYGYCYFAVDRLDTNTFIGFTGLLHQTYKTNFTPFVDLGWRLLPSAWGQGFATEAAQACVEFAFSALHLKKVYAIAPESNVKSQRVMHKLGMTKHAHFIHPKLDVNNELKNCVAFKIENDPL